MIYKTLILIITLYSATIITAAATAGPKQSAKSGEEFCYGPINLKRVKAEFIQKVDAKTPQKLNSMLIRACDDPDSSWPNKRLLLAALAVKGADVKKALKETIALNDYYATSYIIANNTKQKLPLELLLECSLRAPTIANLFLERGASVDMRGPNETTLLMDIQFSLIFDLEMKGRDEINYGEYTRLLIQYGADINAQDEHGNTPLMWLAVACPDDAKFYSPSPDDEIIMTIYEQVSLLLALGARTDLCTTSFRNRKRKTALDIFKEKTHMHAYAGIIQLLEEHQNKTHASSHSGQSSESSSEESEDYGDGLQALFNNETEQDE